MNWILYGFRGAGKTTLGQRLGLPFFDTDHWIEEKTGQPIPELPPEEFLQREKEAVQEASKQTGTVIAVGGATFLDEDNRKRLASTGTLIYLCVSKELLKKRWEKRPIRGKVFETLYAERIPLFESFADAIFYPEKETEKTLWDIINSANFFV